MKRRDFVKSVGAAAALVAALGWTGTAQDARSVISDASKAMGADTVKTLQYSGPGSEYSFGQSFKPGEAWPVWKNKSYMRTIDFDMPALRIDRVADPDPNRKGGGLPPAATQTVIIGPNTAPAQQMPVSLSPYGFLKAASANNATLASKNIAGKTYRVLTFRGSNKAPVNGYIDDKNMVARVETWIDNPVMGDTLIDAAYSEYKDFGGVKVPTKIVERQGGSPTLDLTVADVKVNAPANIQAPQGRGAAPGAPPPAPPVTSSRKLGDGVYLILPAYASIAVDFKDYIVVIEAGNSDARAAAIIGEAKRLIPNKPIKYVINTHPHFDHSSGLRAFVAEGATIITHSVNKAYLQKVLAQPRNLNPDIKAASMKVSVEGVGDKKILTDGNHVIELHRVATPWHHDAELLAWLPKERVLLEADGYLPPAQADSTAPNQLSPTNLVANIKRLNLDVDTIVPVHYPADLRVVNMAELTKRAAMQAPTATR